MSVIVRGMKMPGRCGNCPCFHAENPIYCQAVKADKSKRIAAPYGLPRPDWCPLVEVPTPHSDLIDQGVAVQIAMEWCPDDDGTVGKIGDLRELLDEIEAMPTIIEAEE